MTHSCGRRLRTSASDHQLPHSRGAAHERGTALSCCDRIEFDVLVTATRGSRASSVVEVAVVVLAARSTRIEDYAPLADELRLTVEEATGGVAVRVTA